MPSRPLTIVGPNPGETIRIDPPTASGAYMVERNIPKLGGRMTPSPSRTPWFFAYTPEAAQEVLAWMADAQG